MFTQGLKKKKKKRTGAFPLKLREKRKTFPDMHAYRSLRKISPIAAELHPFFYQLCTRCDLCGLGKARYPTMHFTLANDSSRNAEKFAHQSTEFQGTTPEIHHAFILKIDRIIKRVRTWESLDSSIMGFVCMNT